MSQPPTDSDRLVDFLRQHRQVPPSPAPDLEQRIMAAVAASPHTKTFPHRRQWLIPSAIVASLLIAWGSTSLLMQPKPSAAELASIEAFLENTWEDFEPTSEPSDAELYD
ncbi:MAG TPA: hypothetical protein DDW76_37790 [Cyanobacteria bacterium UBA11369]|nr:hypothetical protein [Cyanobacteria bacterium UBA8553]HAZ43228.1 hypothetical protein [Cyanobacteria bacterium UBA11371]HBE33491.1 hypothetical protein [Cyanobacteria bacterium UBA11368]HBE54350.1 hypothetical protein [Cyanobacteria bacterium UBA11369]